MYRNYKYLPPFLSLSFSFLFSFSQNLVPNPSFEQFNACPDTAPDISSANYWYNAGFTPDYLNACDTNITYPTCGVPLNQYGFQLARTGVAYAGTILSYLGDGINPGDSVREYIEATLLDSLKAGKSYTVSFYVSLADSCMYATHNIGAYFSDTFISSVSPYPLPYTPQIQNNAFNNPLNNKIGWVEINDTFIAEGGEQYIIIGNFKNDANTDTTNLNDGAQGTPWAYYYIDDVEVICLDCTAGIDDITGSDDIKVFPNPSSDFFAIQCKESIIYLEVHNYLGQLIFNKYLHNTNKEILDLSQQKAGIYFLTVQTSSRNYTEKLILTTKKN